jgi:hypothetical protein
LLHLAMLVLPGAASAQAVQDAQAELEPVVDAASLVQPALLSAPGVELDPHVELRGHMARFRLDTPFGPLVADSVELLAEREAEMPALAALDRVTRSEAFVDAAGNRIAATARALAHIALHPVESVLGIPAGVARYFGQRLRSVGDRAQKLSDRAARELGSEGDPFPDDSGPMIDAGAPEEGTQRARKRWYHRVGNEVEREAKRQIGYNQVKRELAARLGIDPYTRNPLIQQRLSSLAWVGSGGHFGAGSALGAVGGVGADVLAQGGRINDIVWKTSPGDLRALNLARVQAWCGDRLLARWFLRRGAFSPTLQTGLVDALDALRPAGGCDALLELAMTADSELEARFLVNAMRMLAAHLGADAAGGSLRPVGAGLAWETVQGEWLLPLPVDRLSWTGDLRAFLDRREFRIERKTVLIGGDASLLARRGLAQRGWNVVVRAPWPGAPPYAHFDEPAPVDTDG